MDQVAVDQLAASLAQFEPGFLPYPIFEQIARIVALPIVEFIPLRFQGETIEVLLINRGPDDQLWPNALHTPGTVIRATDLSTGAMANPTAFTRILDDELHGTPVGEPHYIASLLHKSKRGVEQAELYWIEVTSEPRVGGFYDVSNLPAQLIDSQQEFIAQAAADFKDRRP